MVIQDLIEKEMQPFEMPVERGKIKELADAIGDENPIYHDQKFASESTFGGIIAPPIFTVSKEFWRKGPAVWEIAGLNPRIRLHGEEEYEYFKPIVAGDALTCHSKIVDAYEKSGKRGGKMVFLVHEYIFYNQKGEKAVTSKRTTIIVEEPIK